MHQTDPHSSLIGLTREKQTSFSARDSAAVHVQLNVGTTGYDHKPTKGETATIVANLATSEAQRCLTLTELMQLVAVEGRPFTPALLATPKQDGKLSKCNECFTSQQVFALDFDNPGQEIISLPSTLKRATEMDLIPFGGYFTPSSTPDRPKYRILFCLERPAVTERDRQIVMRMLLNLFPAADQGCKDAARHFNGVMSGPVRDPLIDPTGINSIAALTLAWQADLARDKAHYSAKVKRFAAEFGLELQSGCLVMAAPQLNLECGESGDTSNKYQIELAGNSPIQAPETDISDTVGGGEFFRYITTSTESLPEGSGHAKTAGKPDPAAAATRSRHCGQRWDRCQVSLLQCRLIQMLFFGTKDDKPLTHGEFFHLATHFNNVRGADAIFEAALAKTGHNVDRRIGQYRHVPASYQPQRCLNSACRCKDDCPFIQMPNHRNIFSLKFVRGQARQTERTETIGLEDARVLMAEAYDQALLSNKRVSIIRADCGAGKTYSMIPVMLEQVQAGKKVVYAAPTHRLLNETHYNLLSTAADDVKIYRWPDLIQYIEIDDADLAAEIKHYWATGHYGNAATKICQWAQRQVHEKQYFTTDRSNLDEQARDILDYLSAKEHQEDRSPGIWLMSHARLIYAPIKADLCFVDEDILMRSLLTVRQCRYSNLTTLISGLKALSFDRKLKNKDRERAQNAAESITQLMQTIWQAKKNQVTPMPSMDFPSASLLTKVLPTPARYSSDTEQTEGGQSDLLEFLTSRSVAFVRPGKNEDFDSDAILYVSRRNFPRGIDNYVIASASVNRRLYEALEGAESIDFIAIPPIEHQGELVLHPEKSFANCSLGPKFKANTLKCVVDLLEKYPNAAVICSKKMRAALSPAQRQRVICTFGATEGLNCYQGQDLLVIGALHRPDYVYKLLAVALGHKLGLDTTLELEYQRINRNGYEYHAVAFDDELLREIQFAMIETELEQAVGRARLVSNDCRVDLFTNIPLPQCKLAS